MFFLDQNIKKKTCYLILKKEALVQDPPHELDGARHMAWWRCHSGLIAGQAESHGARPRERRRHPLVPRDHELAVTKPRRACSSARRSPPCVPHIRRDHVSVAHPELREHGGLRVRLLLYHLLRFVSQNPLVARHALSLRANGPRAGV